jgi:hypothetical protein
VTRDQAIVIAERARTQFDVPQDYTVNAASLRIIEIVPTEPVRDALPAAGPVLDRLAWIVRFGVQILWAELAVDDATGAVIRFRRSRTAAANWDRETDG